METFLEIVPYLVAMSALVFVSAFFSSAEAALFSLKAEDRRALKNSTNRSHKTAAILLRDPERLLSAVLFWNLVVNLLYFTLASLATLRLQSGNSSALSVGFPFGALLTMIFLSEMLPKTLAVAKARELAGLLGRPLAASVAALDPIMPVLRNVTDLSERVAWPNFQQEPYLEVADLERAIKITTTNKELLDQEYRILRNIVALSDMGVEECMRPRTQLVTFKPPVTLTDIRNEMPPSGYLLISEKDSDEIESAINLRKLTDLRSEHLEYLTKPVLYIPWCITAADALHRMQTKELETSVVVNELGETIGAITRDDILELIFSDRSSRSERLLNREPVKPVSEGVWEVLGMTNLRVLEEYFGIKLPEARRVTVGGVIQETLQRIPEIGDECHWGPFQFNVTDTIDDDQILVRMEHAEAQES